MPAELKTLKHDSGDIKASLRPQIIYRYVLLCIVDNIGKRYMDFGREGLNNYLRFFSYWHLNVFLELLWRSTKQAGVQIIQVRGILQEALVIGG